MGCRHRTERLDGLPCGARRLSSIDVDPLSVQLDIDRAWVTVAWPLPDERTPEGQAAQFGIWAAFRYTARIADKCL